MLKVIFVSLCHFMPCNHAEIATKQAVLETGWFKSYACTNLCNPFGLSWKGKLQEFESIEQACQEYYRQIYLQYTGGDYYEFLTDIGYAQDPNYIWKLKHIYINGIHDTTKEQRDSSVHGRSRVVEGKVLPILDTRGYDTHQRRETHIPLIMGLADTCVEKSSVPADSSNDHSRYRGHRYGRHRKAPQVVIKRVP